MIKSVTFFFYTLKDAQHVNSLRCNPLMHSASLPFQNAELPVKALSGAGVASTPTPTVTKGLCLLTHRLSLNETRAICRFINYTLSHAASLSPRTKGRWTRTSIFLRYINVRLQPSWFQLPPLSPSLFEPLRYAINYNVEGGEKWHWCLCVYTLPP